MSSRIGLAHSGYKVINNYIIPSFQGATTAVAPYAVLLTTDLGEFYCLHTLRCRRLHQCLCPPLYSRIRACKAVLHAAKNCQCSSF